MAQITTLAQDQAKKIAQPLRLDSWPKMPGILP